MDRHDLGRLKSLLQHWCPIRALVQASFLIICLGKQQKVAQLGPLPRHVDDSDRVSDFGLAKPSQ